MTAEGAPGFYGKVATRGDFVSRRLPRTFLAPWDNWLQAGLACSRDQLGERWLEVYLTSPLWRFALAPGVCGDLAWVGILLPSVDRVGRYFPLTVARPLGGGGTALAALAEWSAWLEAAERLGLSALDEDFDIEAFDKAVGEGSPAAAPGEPPAAGGSRAPAQASATVGWHFAVGAGDATGPAARLVADALLDAQLPLHSVWSSRGSDLVGPSLALARALPPPSAFAALLDGGWARWGWANGPATSAAADPAPIRQPPAPVSEPVLRALAWTSAAATHEGRVRHRNEDAFLDDPARGLWAVADGMGGHADGAVASRQVVRSLQEVDDPPDLDRFAETACAALTEANARLRERAAAHAGEEARVIGSTVVALLARGAHVSCLWAGDSRIYLFRDRELRALTRDHSVVEELVRRGEVDPEYALAHPEANALTRAVGGEDRLEVDELCVDVRPGDVFLLCSDGLTKEVSHAEMAEVLQAVPDLQGACDALVRRALDHGGRDNVTVVLARADGRR